MEVMSARLNDCLCMFQLDFPAKPKGQLQKENDQKFLKLMKETNGKPNPPNNIIPPQGKTSRRDMMEILSKTSRENLGYKIVDEIIYF